MVYPNHISNQVYFSLFQTNFDYFLYYGSFPGGIAEWGGAFLSQFYRWTWAGALMQVCFTGILYFFVRKNNLFSESSIGEGLWSLVPVFLLFFLQMQYSFLAGNSLQVVFWFAFLWGYMKIKRKSVRIWMVVAGIYPVILLTGALPSLLWIITLLLYEWRMKSGYKIALVILVSGIACFLLLRSFFPVDDREWFTFFPRMDELLNPGSVWLLYLWIPGTIVLLLVGEKHLHKLTRFFSGQKGMAIMVIFVVAMLYLGKQQFYYPEVERMLGLQREAVQGNWATLLEEKPERQDRLAAYAMTNLALAHMNELPERVLDFPQAGIAGLIPVKDPSYFGMLCRSWVYDWLGVKHEALHWSVETTIAHGDNPPPFLLQQIAALLMELGKESAAAPFLKRLVAVPFYREWARDQLKQVARIEFQRKLRISVPFREEGLSMDQETEKQDFRVGTMGPFYDLFRLAEKYPGNMHVRDYLLTGLLLEKDIPTFYEWFGKYYPKGYSGEIPRLYRQALILVGFSKLDMEVHKKYRMAVDELQDFKVYMDRCHTFGEDKEAAAKALQKECGNTFWYYMHFR